MRDMRRRQKKLEKQRRKREERRAELRRDPGPRDVLLVDPDYATNVTSAPFPRDAATWPVVRAYVPVPDVWRTTGLGLAGVIRQQPDGRYAGAFFMLELYDHGLKGAFGKGDETLEGLDAILADMADQCAPSEVGPVELAADFAWGARALANADGLVLPAEFEAFLALLPRPRGTPRDWKHRLTGPDGLTPAGLVRVIRENPPPDDLPEGKELAVTTVATFSIADHGKAVAALRGAAPGFRHEGRDGAADLFAWTDEQPGWSPLAFLSRRQALGSVRVDEEGRLVAEAGSLSLTAKLISRLRGTVGEGLRLEDCRWTGMRDLLRMEARQA